MSAAAVLAPLLLAAALHGSPSVAECWKGSTTNGSNPGLNTMLLCIAANDLAELKVYFPNTPIGEPPTTCTARGRRSEAEGGFRILTGEGQCENGSSMGAYDLRCAVDAAAIMSCTFSALSGNPVDVRLEKVFP
jgi:hypothetical protein